MRSPRNGIASGAAVALSIAVFGAGVRWGTFAVGGSDSHCYVSQAELFASGRLRLEPPLPSSIVALAGEEAFVPVGYRRDAGGQAVAVPICPPGLSLIMAAARLVGGRAAVFLVVPLAGAAAIWLTFLFGRVLAGSAVGIVSAALLACSPIFLYQLMQPMTDVPAATCWLLAIGLAANGGWRAAARAGAASSLALLIRPNLLPAAGVVAILAAFEPQGQPAPVAQPMRFSRRRLFAFAAGIAPACVAVAVLNRAMHGSAGTSGYGSLSELFSAGNIATNAARYVHWLIDTHTPMLLISAMGPFVLPSEANVRGRHSPRLLAGTALAFAIVVYACYLPYFPFDHWSYLRFMLPALPLLIATMCAAVYSLTAYRSQAAGVGALVAVACIGAYWLTEARARAVFELHELEARFVEAGKFVASQLPARTVVLAESETGSVPYYSAHPALSWGAIEPEKLDRTVNALRAQGYSPYVLLEAGEEPNFRSRFGDATELGRLDWPPLADIRTRVPVRIYDPAARARYLAGEQIPSRTIWPSSGTARERR